MIRENNWSILPTVATLGILGLPFWASPAAAQLAPWQQPPSCSPSPPAGEIDQTPVDPLRATPVEGSLALSGTPSLDTPENSSAPWAREDYEQEGGPLGLGRGYFSNLACDLVHDRFWVRSEFLAWW